MEAITSENLIAIADGFMCRICGANIGRQRAKRHILEVHLENNGVRYECPKCKKIYKNRSSFSVHIYNYHKDIKGLKFDQCTINSH